jgi:hypothetical protein
MGQKIGRNELCPCGSGVKYKKCCMNMTKETWQSYTKSHESAHILNTVIALQMTPNNHGKEVRIEELANTAMQNLAIGESLCESHKITEILNREFNHNVYEDLPVNMYSENVVLQSNHTVFSGISSYAIDILRALIDIIYSSKDKYPKEFIKRAIGGISFLLNFGDLIAKEYNIKGYNTGLLTGKYEPLHINNVIDCGYSFDDLIPIIKRSHITEEDFLSFIVDPSVYDLWNGNPDESPLLSQPIVEWNNKYYFLLISNQANAINQYVLRLSESFNCTDVLVRGFYRHTWMEILEACHMIGWHDPIQMSFLPTPMVKCDETIFQIDQNWVSYVCLIHSDKDCVLTKNGHMMFDVTERIKEVRESIRANEKYSNARILATVLYASLGETLVLTAEEFEDDIIYMPFPACAFISLALTEKWEPLSLLHFAKCINNSAKNIMPLSSTLDKYKVYKHHHESLYLSDDKAPDMIYLEPNEGEQILFESKGKIDLHGVEYTINSKPVLVPVIQNQTHQNIYIPRRFLGFFAQCIESMGTPIWITHKQMNNINEFTCSILETHSTAILFWLNKIANYIKDDVLQMFSCPIEIEIQFDGDITNITQYLKKQCNFDDLISISQEGSHLTVIYREGCLALFSSSNNEYERLLILAIVKALSYKSHEELQAIIDRTIPFGDTKMILQVDNEHNLLLEPRWLDRAHYISEYHIQKVLDEIKEFCAKKDFTTLLEKEQKISFLNQLVDFLYNNLNVEIEKYDSSHLLKALILKYESLVFNREHFRMRLPAKISCYGWDEGSQELSVKEKQFTESGIAYRSLIEYIAARSINKTSKYAGNEDIDYMLSIMFHIVNHGTISDAIREDVSNHVIEKLESGRLGIYDDDFSNHLDLFTDAHYFDLAENHIKSFDSFFRKQGETATQANKVRLCELKDIDLAFMADWNVSLTQIYSYIGAMYGLCVDNHKSVMDVSLGELQVEIMNRSEDKNVDSIYSFIDKFSLKERNNPLVAPDGYKNYEVYPWAYNREFSYLRRCIVQYQSNGKIYCVFGFRALISAVHQMHFLVNEGKLKHGGVAIEKLQGNILSEKGKVFNEDVRSFLKTIPYYLVADYDVSIKKNGNLTADQDYGDIDVFVYDKKHNCVFNIECKNTSVAKNAKEMRKEIDDYLGENKKDNKKSLAQKHYRRHCWLRDNIKQVREFFKIENDACVYSFLLTATSIPTAFLRKGKLPLPIFSFNDVKAKGVDYIYDEIVSFCKKNDLR